MSDFQACVRSVIPGRARLRHPFIKTLSADDIETARQWISSIDGVFSVDINPLVGSALILWDSEKLSTESFLEQLENLLTMAVSMMGDDKDLSLEPTPVGKVAHVTSKVQQTATKGVGSLAVMIAGNPKEGHSIQRVQRMAINRTMLAALVVSMGGILTRSTALHVTSGVAFLGLLSMHLYNNRRLL